MTNELLIVLADLIKVFAVLGFGLAVAYFYTKVLIKWLE